MAQKKIDQTTIHPDGRPGDDAFTAFAICNDNADDAESRLRALESGAGDIGADVEALQLGLQQEGSARQQADVAEAQARQQALQVEAQARQQADAALDLRIDSLSERVLGDNVLINGDFDVWQRGTSFTVSNVYAADRWFIQQGGVTGQTMAKNALQLGDANFPGSENNLYVTVTGNSSATGAFQVFEQRVEDCRTFAGKVSTLSFRVFNAGAAGRKIAVEFAQTFGSGGSAAVLGIAPQVFTLTAGLNIITKTVTLPPVTGKTANARHAAVAIIWTTAGSDFNSRTAGLGLQVGALYFGQMKWEAGAVATPFKRREPGAELLLCYRYGEPVGFIANAQGADFATFSYKVPKRDVPTLTVLGNSIYPATLNARGSTTWFSMDGRVASSVSSYCFADSEI
ncbi:hypothetical protein [Stenotrophomonas maltophilia]|uniref:Uncharacterized protein n=1 Tax=Stenotrophomonas maltophilia TaxID=40324 RepID=A0A2W6HWC1_STEMA|nr:hypothetical protein [Stenotrophomonas maltophilia]PZS87787.1 hypothetical protein A7X83_16595 [Stenotrophomonas maltophilia]